MALILKNEYSHIFCLTCFPQLRAGTHPYQAIHLRSQFDLGGLARGVTIPNISFFHYSHTS